MKTVTLICCILFIVFSGFVHAADEVADGIYIAGDEPRLLCSLSGFKTSDRPSIEQDMPVLTAADTAFDVILPPEASQILIEPRTLRLLRLSPPHERSIGKIVPLSFELDRANRNMFHMAIQRGLEPGTYHFCVEKADFSKGKSEIAMKMIFIECSFIVEERETK